MANFRYKTHSIFYQIKGEGEPVVFLHGFCSDHTVWDEFADDLAEDYQVLVMDLPGFGTSDVIPNISIAEIAEILKALLDELGWQKITLIGHSMGGYISMAFAKQYADRLRGLGMFHSHPYDDSVDKKSSRQKVIDFIERRGAVLYLKQLIPALFTPSFVKDNSFTINPCAVYA